ncbi:hypothetical protein B0T25DRAFT_541733 [Lasiosphaeria hispida]|uniref:Uncharacterized protein n=1 Tax=Lasiosphaeria hispida TaxID=260671 RepID=A0AAJ0HGS5_9PEZI|nr:hypothetical protein B0T25DRAFT_541733 [Lasiosphaeria hispida]
MSIANAMHIVRRRWPSMGRTPWLAISATFLVAGRKSTLGFSPHESATTLLDGTAHVLSSHNCEGLEGLRGSFARSMRPCTACPCLATALRALASGSPSPQTMFAEGTWGYVVTRCSCIGLRELALCPMRSLVSRTCPVLAVRCCPKANMHQMQLCCSKVGRDRVLLYSWLLAIVRV